MRPLYKQFLSLLALASLAVTATVAQQPATKALIREKVDENQLATLRGNTPPAAIAQNDAGRVAANMPMADLILVLQRSPEVQAEFDAFVASQYDATSPNFHQWLTPEQIGEKFGPALSDIAAVSSWLSGHGLSVDEVSKDRMTIRFSGSARQVEATFHTELHNLTVKGEAHFANMTDPQIPLALEPVVLGPKALHNFIPKPLHRTGGTATLNAETGKWQRAVEPNTVAKVTPKANAAFTGARPDIGFSCGSGCEVEDLTPYDFAAIYNLSPLWSAGIDGTGQTIAIAGRSDVRASDVSSFRSTFGLTGGAFNLIKNGTDPGFCTGTSGLCTLDDQIENALDVEWAGATAPKATVDLVVTQQTNSNDAIYESANYVLSNVGTLKAKILNVSYGNCELFMGTSGNSAYNTLWQSSASAGIAVFVATGDSGSPACDQGAASQGPYGATFGLAVSGLASTPYNTAVGGTDLNYTTISTYWNTSNDTHGATAKGYIPEVPWNDTCTNPLEVAFINQALGTSDSASVICNKIANGQITSSTNPQGVLNLVNTVGAGGGKSACTTNSTTNSTQNPDPTSCSAGYSKPSWQTGVSGIPSDSKRDIPDVSFFAGNGFLGSAYLICVSDWGTCVTSTSAAAEPTVGEIGGTSAASPAMAGIMALINQKAGSAQGNPNKELYTLAAAQNYANCKSESVTNSGACYFNDIDTGSINMPCAAGSTGCNLASSGNTIGILAGYDAAAGFDLASGLGSMNVANVVNHWASSVGTTASTVTVTPTPGSIIVNHTLSVAVTVAGSSGTPTGTVTLTGGGYTSTAQSLASGATTFSVPANSLTVGTDTLTASYSGDSTYASNTGTASVTVTAAPVPTVTVSPAANAINSGQSLSVPVTVAGASGTPTGNVTLSGGGYTSSAQALASGSTTFNIPGGSLSAGSITLTATYAGDSTYGTASGTAVVTVTQSTYALAATTPANITRGATAASTITWTTANNFSSTVKLSTCTLNSGGPSNSSADTPKCTVSSTAFDSTGSGTATVTTTAATTALLQKPHLGGWAEAGSGAVLALIAFFGIPARRRGWRAMAGMVLLLIALGSLAACGGGGGGGGGGGTSDPGTASGTYTFTVTATGNDAAHTTANKTFTVTVN